MGKTQRKAKAEAADLKKTKLSTGTTPKGAYKGKKWSDAKRQQHAKRSEQVDKHFRPHGKKVEVNVSDSDINAADLRPLDEGRSKGPRNDFSWYNHYPLYMENVSGVNYASPIGSPIRYFTKSSSEWNLVSGIPSSPGFMTTYFLPTYGRMDAYMRSAANRAATQLYAAMRIKLTSRADYDATDTMLYIIAMDSAYILYAYATKLYGVLNQVSPFNLYTMHAACEANGAKPSTFLNNLGNFRALINYYALAISKRQVPADLDLIKRHTWLVQNMFTDAADAKAQTYTYVPTGIYILNEQTSGDKKLVFRKIRQSPADPFVTLSDIENLMNEVLNSLETSQDVDQMSADIYKAFEGSTLAAGLIPESYTTPVGYSAEVLAQIENSVLVGQIINNASITPSITVEQNLASVNGPTLIQSVWAAPIVDASDDEAKVIAECYLRSNGFLNFHHADVQHEDTVIASRAMCMPQRIGIPTGYTKTAAQYIDYGTEIYSFATMMNLNSNGSTANRHYQTYDINRASDSIYRLAQWSAFDWAPVYNNVDISGSTVYVSRFQDLDVYGVLSADQVADIHYGAVMSEFYSDKYPEKVLTT